MDGTFFSLDFKALVLTLLAGVAFYLLWRWGSAYASPSIAFPSLKDLEIGRGRARFEKLSRNLLWGTLLCFSLAFIDPHFLLNRPLAAQHLPPPTKGVGIYLVLDQSGSMKDQVLAKTSQGERFLSKIDLVKEVTQEFIDGNAKLGLKGRPNDMMGLMFFARGAKVMSPLSLDHEGILKELQQFQPVKERDQDGTSLGYAIFKAANLMAATKHFSEELIKKGEPAYTIKNNIVILLTDGLQDPNPLDKGKRLRNMDIPEAAANAKKLGVRLYLINVDPALNTEELAPYRHIMQRAAESTGGKFYMVDNVSNLQSIYKDIDGLEKSDLPVMTEYDKDKRPDLYQRVSLYPYLIVCGLLLFILATLFETTILRRVP